MSSFISEIMAFSARNTPSGLIYEETCGVLKVFHRFPGFPFHER